MKGQMELISKIIKDSISRCIERMQLEGNSALKLPEQFAACLCVKLWQEPGLHEGKRISWEEKMMQEDIWNIMDAYHLGRTMIPWNRILTDVNLITDPAIFKEIWRLVNLVCEEYSECTFKDVSSLGGFMEYMIETISRMENKEYFFTPQSIAELMVKLVAPVNGSFWDPACGSGTFLCKASEEVEKQQKQGTERLHFPMRGTDINEQMVKLAEINLFFHGISENVERLTRKETSRQSTDLFRMCGFSPEEAENGILLETTDAFMVTEKFDYIVANPPVSSMYASMQLERGHIVPTKALHLQFLQLIMHRLKERGRAAVLINESLLFSTRTAERTIREALVETHGLKTVISLPQGTFAPYTNAKSSLILFGGEGQFSDNVLFYEMENPGYSLDKNRTIQEKSDIPDILHKELQREELYRNWIDAKNRGMEYNADGVAVPVEWKEEKVWFADSKQIRENDYILSAGRYRPRSEEEELENEEPEELLEQLLEMEQEIQEYLERIKGAVDEG